MLNSLDVELFCKNYFMGFNEIRDKKSSKGHAALKILSYIFIIPPLVMGITYGISSLISRVKQLHNHDQTTHKTKTAAKILTDDTTPQTSALPENEQEAGSSASTASQKPIFLKVVQKKVLRQGLNNDHNRCGAHALKNALAYLRFWQDNNETDLETHLNDVNFFKTINDIVWPKGDRDSTGLELHQALQRYAKENNLSHSQISIFDYVYSEDVFAENLGNVKDNAELKTLSNLLDLYNKIQRKEAFKQAFVMGTAGHWSTLILDYDGNEIRSIGLDSNSTMSTSTTIHMKTLIRFFEFEKATLYPSFLDTYLSYIRTLLSSQFDSEATLEVERLYSKMEQEINNENDEDLKTALLAMLEYEIRPELDELLEKRAHTAT